MDKASQDPQNEGIINNLRAFGSNDVIIITSYLD